MFGRLIIEQVAQVDPTMDLQTAVATLVKATEDVEIVRWVELPASVPLFLLVPGDPDSGAVYVLGSQERNLVRRGLRGRTIRRVQRKPACNAPEPRQKRPFDRKIFRVTYRHPLIRSVWVEVAK